MQDRLKFPKPEGDMERIVELAYDLAYGRHKGLWGERFRIELDKPTRVIHKVNDYSAMKGTPALGEYFQKKWEEDIPDFALLAAHSYLSKEPSSGTPYSEVYNLAPRAYGLLESMDFANIEVFISYRREHSSAFALLIEARLELVGIKAFVDRSIPAGDDWHGLLEQRVRALVTS